MKVGHAGTLDPFAEGILIVCTGKNTKQIESYMGLKKEYMCKIRFGSETDTLDGTGNVINSCKAELKGDDYITSILQEFVGKISQIPPIYSAIKINGKKCYELARAGVQFTPLPRQVEIESIQLIDSGYNFIDIIVSCGRGTYIRSLARDIAYKMNNYAYVEELCRTKVGEFDKTNAVKMEDVDNWIYAHH